MSLAAGTGGEPLRTERFSALPPFTPLRSGETGRIFANEVARALERARGEEPRARQLDQREGQRRAERRAGFGRERDPKQEPRPSEATLRPEHAPVVAQPATAPPSIEPRESPPPGSKSAPPLESTLTRDTGTPQSPPPAAPGAQPATMLAPGTAAAVRSAAESAAARRVSASEQRPSEHRPLALPQLTRSGDSKSQAPAGAAPARPGPDPAVFERTDEILRQIRLHLTPSVRRLTLDLEPANLGRLSVQLALRTGKVTAIVRAESPETLERLQEREGDLLDVFAQRGIRAESVRFELGFGGAPARLPPRARSAGPGSIAPSAPDSKHAGTSRPASAPSANIDFQA